jgi:hypothetical protein
MYLLPNNRPRQDIEAPFEMISTDPWDLQAIKFAEYYSEPIMISDWTQFKSWEYMDAMRATGYDIL